MFKQAEKQDAEVMNTEDCPSHTCPTNSKALWPTFIDTQYQNVIPLSCSYDKITLSKLKIQGDTSGSSRGSVDTSTEVWF